MWPDWKSIYHLERFRHGSPQSDPILVLNLVRQSTGSGARSILDCAPIPEGHRKFIMPLSSPRPNVNSIPLTQEDVSDWRGKCICTDVTSIYNSSDYACRRHHGAMPQQLIHDRPNMKSPRVYYIPDLVNKPSAKRIIEYSELG